MEIYSRDISCTTVAEEKYHTGKLEYQLKIYSFRRRHPRKMTSTIIGAIHGTVLMNK